MRILLYIVTMLTTHQLKDASESLFGTAGFGVYSIDHLPAGRQTSCMFIFNTDSSNLPGTHWIAVMVKKGVGFVFDPFGHAPPARIAHWMNTRNYQWSSNLRQLQSETSTLCGAYCLYFLWLASSPYLKGQLFENIMVALFPLDMTPRQHDSTVRNFIQLYLPHLFAYL